MRDLGLVPGQFGPAPDPRLYDEIRTKVRDDGLIEVIGVRDGKEIRLGAFGKRQPVNTAALRLQNLASDSVFRDLLPEPPAEVPDEAAEVSEEDEMAEFLDSLDRDNALRIRERQLIQSLSDLEILVRRGDDLARVIANTVVNDVVSDFSRGSVSINASDISAALSTVFGDRTLEENRARERIRDETIPLEIEAVGRVIGKLLADSLKLLLMALPVGRALQLLRILPRIVRR